MSKSPPRFETGREKKIASLPQVTDLTKEKRAENEVRMRAWQKRGIGIQNKTDTTSILALA